MRQEIAAQQTAYAEGLAELGREIERREDSERVTAKWCMRAMEELAELRAAVGAHEGEATVDAVKRVVAISEAWEAMAKACRTPRRSSLWAAVAATF